MIGLSLAFARFSLPSDVRARLMHLSRRGIIYLSAQLQSFYPAYRDAVNSRSTTRRRNFSLCWTCSSLAFLSLSLFGRHMCQKRGTSYYPRQSGDAKTLGNVYRTDSDFKSLLQIVFTILITNILWNEKFTINRGGFCFELTCLMNCVFAGKLIN